MSLDGVDTATRVQTTARCVLLLLFFHFFLLTVCFAVFVVGFLLWFSLLFIALSVLFCSFWFVVCLVLVKLPLSDIAAGLTFHLLLKTKRDEEERHLDMQLQNTKMLVTLVSLPHRLALAEFSSLML